MKQYQSNDVYNHISMMCIICLYCRIMNNGSYVNGFALISECVVIGRDAIVPYGSMGLYNHSCGTRGMYSSISLIISSLIKNGMAVQGVAKEKDITIQHKYNRRNLSIYKCICTCSLWHTINNY